MENHDCEMHSSTSRGSVLIMGAGLAGLTAGRMLAAHKVPVSILEAGKETGGLARTIEHNGFRFDIGGHRFATGDPKMEHYVRRLLGDDCLTVPRSSKILLQGCYFDYPLRPINACFGFGPRTSFSILMQYLQARIRKRITRVPEISLEDWVVSHFGRKMFEIFFRDYSEKVWGIDCDQIDMRWMEQRIQGMSLGKAILKSVLPGKLCPPTLDRKFLYPRWGIGQISENLCKNLKHSNEILIEHRISRVIHDQKNILEIECDHAGETKSFAANDFISTIPLPTMLMAMYPRPPSAVLSAASKLRSRDLVIVAIMLNVPKVTDQTWIYTPDKRIPFGRLHEPTNWSLDMAPRDCSLLVAEYFCFRGDETWKRNDSDLVENTLQHLVAMGLIRKNNVVDSKICRIRDAYPLFNVGYHEECKTIYNYLGQFRNLHLAGRGGMFRYLNMDHAMQAGMDVANEIIHNYAGANAKSVAEVSCA